VGETLEGLSGSERLACSKRGVENLRGPINSWGTIRPTDNEPREGKPGDRGKPESKSNLCR
jgi:hypothetical protein